MIINGFHAINGVLLNNSNNIIEIFINKDRNDIRINNVLTKIKRTQITLHRVSKDKLNQLTKNASHQGIAARIINNNIATFNELKDFIKTEQLKLILILDGITDPHNLGACLRSANAFAVDCVILTKNGSADFNEIVYKSSTGAVSNLKIFKVVNLVRSIKLLQQNDVWVLGLDANATNDINKQNINTKLAVIMGAEGKGLRRLVKENCDYLVKIPIDNNVDSLNVAVATGIALFSIKTNL